jgi:tetratricopeptide (TPR) repeat protein
MPIDPNELRTGGALQGAVAASLLRQREIGAELAPGERVGAYRVVRELGRGGMAIVYLAERDDGEYRQQVALKWMPQAQPDAASETLFRRERQALADLRHPHIARLIDGGRNVQGRPWFAMELILGEPLDRHCVRQQLPLAQRLRLFGQVCAAVAFAHARGVIHRDIKPSNVLVDSDGDAKLLDFGIAQLLDQHDELASGAFTPGFASPEQARGEPVTVASDVYQLGRLLASLLSSNVEEQTTIAAGPSALGADAPPPLPATLAPSLAAILHRACAADPAARYATADALAADVRAFVERRPVAARGGGAGYTTVCFFQRHPVAVGAATIVLLLAIGAGLLFANRLRIERDAATHQARIATTVLDFMHDDLLAAADPAAAPGQELTVRAALDLASASASVRFDSLPVEHAAVRVALASLYQSLGRFDDAEREARAAVALGDGGTVPAAQRREAEATLASVLIARDKLDEARRLYEALRATALAVDGADSRAVLGIDDALGLILERSGEYERALELHQRVHDVARRTLGADDTLTRESAESAAVALQMLGRHGEARPLLQQVLDSRARELGARHPATLAAAHELGVLERHSGRLDAALERLQPTLSARREVLGVDHPETLSSANEVATVLQELKRYDEAEPLFRDVLERRLRRLGEEHRFTRNSMSNLGLLFSLSGRLQEAAPLYERTLAIETRLTGERHPDTLALMHNIAGLYRKQGRLEDALAMHRRVLENAEASSDLGPDAWQTALFRAGMAMTLQVGRRYEEADVEFARTIRTLDATLGPEHPRAQRAREMRAALQAERDAAK